MANPTNCKRSLIGLGLMLSLLGVSFASSAQTLAKHYTTKSAATTVSEEGDPANGNTTGELKGRVLDENGKPISGANVQDLTSGNATTTDAEGRFVISDLKAGRHRVVFTASEVGTVERILVIQGGETVTWSVNLSLRTKELNVVEVTSDGLGLAGSGLTRLGAGNAEATRITAGIKNEVIKLDDVNANLATNVSRQVFAKVPGVHVWESDASGVQINIGSRGLSPNRSWEFNIRQNGFDISSDIFGYPEAYYNPPLEHVERIEVLRGAASLQYGPQFGGMVNYITKSAGGTKPVQFENTSTAGSYGLLSNYSRLHGTKGIVDYQGTFFNRQGDGWRTNSRYNINSASGEVKVRLTENLTLGAELSYLDYINQQAGGLTDAQFAADARQSNRTRNWFQINWVVPAFTLDYRVNDRLKINYKTFGLVGQRNSIGFTAAQTVRDTVNRVTGQFANRTIDRDYYRNWGQEVRVGYDFDLFDQRHTVVGGYRTFIGTTRRVNGTGDRGTGFNLDLTTPDFSRDLTFTTFNNAFFAEVLIRPTSSTRIVPGIRAEFINNKAEGRLTRNFSTGVDATMAPLQSNRQVILTGIRAEQDIVPGVEVYANFSQAFRPALYSDLTPATTLDVIDPNLKDASGYNIDGGIRGTYKNWLSWDLSVYQLVYNNRIGNLQDTVSTPSGLQSFNFRTNIGNAITSGFEGFAEVNILKALLSESSHDFSIFGSLTFQNSRYADFTTRNFSNGRFNETSFKDKRVENTPNSIHRLGATYAYAGKYSITYQWNYVGQQFTDATNTDAPNAAGTAGSLPAYEISDLSLSAKLNDYLVFRASLNNVFDARYATRRAGGYPGPGLLPGEGRNFACSLTVKL